MAGDFDYQSQNPYQELVNSFSTQDALFLKNSDYPNGLPYVPSLPDEAWQFIAPAKAAPPASQGTAAGLTIPQLATSIASGFSGVQQSTLFNQFAAQLGVSPSQVPILTQNILTTLGLDGSKLANLLLQPNQPGYTPSGSLDMSNIGTLSQLGTRLQQAGFNVNSILSDAQFAALSSSAPVDIVRFTRVYTLAELTGSDSFNAALLSNQPEIKNLVPGGTLNFDATAKIYLTYGLDTAGFYLLAGKTAEAKFDGSGQLTGVLASAGSMLGIGTMSYAKSVDLKTNHTDGKIRLTDLNLPAGQLLQSQPIVGSTGLKLHLDANLGAIGNVKWDGGWSWKLTDSGAVYQPELSGFDTDTLMDSLSQTIDTGLGTLQSQSSSILAASSKIPMIGSTLQSITSLVLGNELNYDNPTGLAGQYLAEQGFQISTQATPQQLLNHILKGVAPPTELLSLTYTRTENAPTQKIVASGGISLAAWSSSLGISGSADVQASASVKTQITIGLDTVGGFFVKEGSYFQADASATGTVSGSANVAGLASLSISTGATFTATAKLLVDDSDSTVGEKVYLSGPQWNSILNRPESLQATGTVQLDQLKIAGGISALPKLPKLTLVGTGSFNISNGSGTFTVPDSALIDGYSQVIAAGIQQVKLSAADLAKLSGNIPLIGKDVSGVLNGAISSGLDFSFPTTNVSAYLATKGFTVQNVLPLSSLLSGNLSGDLLQFKYYKSYTATMGQFTFAGSLSAGPAKFDLGGKLTVAPQMTIDATFGIDLARGPYVLEGATIAATLPVSGTLTGKASVGSLVKIDVTAQANINATAALMLSDFDKVPNEKLYLFETAGTDAIHFDEIVKQDKAVSIGGTANLSAALKVNNPASQIPIIGNLLPHALYSHPVQCLLTAFRMSFRIRSVIYSKSQSMMQRPNWMPRANCFEMLAMQ